MAAPPQSATSSRSMTSLLKVAPVTTWPPTLSLSSLPSTPLLKAMSKTKAPLNSIFGEVREGEIFTMLGASGSNKSTLIDALVNRIKQESLQDSITLNGENLEG
ncbi:unnamed protein product [Musa acuminata subsp. malaccensis]|uniref:(wild Malaysian banana) hypothetical protein n=1 Tax=Musa acuminata subsp. malaccensis TaxID=214687 RepID=A0A804IBG4_MUSAM|nr:unnamed protein product [Musa acuminata subsp. malaccensis]